MQEPHFPRIWQMAPGTFNVRLVDPPSYVPPDVGALRAANGDQSCISQAARVVEINGQKLQAWLYDGGWPEDTVELLCEMRLAEVLEVTHGDRVVLIVEEDVPFKK